MGFFNYHIILLLCFSAPIGSLVTNHHGYRVAAFIGGAVSASGLCLSFLVTNIGFLFFSYGVLIGKSNWLFFYVKSEETYLKFKPPINKYALVSVKHHGKTSLVTNFLKPTIGEYQSVVRNIRKEEIVLNRKESHVRTYYSVRSGHNVVVVMNCLPFVPPFWNVMIFKDKIEILPSW